MVMYRFDVKIFGRKKNKYRAVRFFFKASARLLLSRKKSQPRALTNIASLSDTQKKKEKKRETRKRERLDVFCWSDDASEAKHRSEGFVGRDREQRRCLF